jgi:CrcB protein
VRERWDILCVIAVGGALGSLARWGLAVVVPHAEAQFPLSTFLVNVVGSLLLGVLMVLVLEVWPPTRYARPFWGVGVMGGFTTFSTFVFDNYELARSGAAVLAVVYTLMTVVVVLLAVASGVLASRAGVRAWHRRRTRAAERSTSQRPRGPDPEDRS